MKKITFLKVYVLIAFSIFCIQNSQAQTYCINSSADQQTGTQDGFDWELWNQNSTGTACMELTGGCKFKADWSGIENYLARRGLRYDQTQEHSSYGTFSATFNCIYNPNCSSGNSYLGVYGWTYNPVTDDLVEYYIIEDWCNWIPSMDPNAVNKGNINVNGSNYEIITVQKYNAPSILGDRDFTQYFSVRQNTRTSGTVNITDHFNMWESLGMNMGYMHEVMFLVEGYQNSGSAEFTDLEVTVTGGGTSVTGVDLTPASVSIVQGSSTTLTAQVFPTTATNQTVTYSSNNTSVASVNSSGVVTANNTGTVTITVTTNDGGFTDDCIVTVTPTGTSVTGVDLTPASVSIVQGNSTTLTAQVFPTTATDQTVTYISNNVSVASVNSSGVVTANNTGTATITVTTNDGGFTDNCIVTVLPTGGSNTIVIRARGTQGGEHINLLINGTVISGWNLTTNYQDYAATVSGDGDINVQFDNDASGRDVQIDYIAVNGVVRQAENMEYNTGAYDGSCGGGTLTEWLHCNGVIGFGNISDGFGTHTIVVRARGTQGGEHIDLLIDGSSEGSWWLSNSYQEFTATVEGDGDINIRFDNDGTNMDVQVDWVKVDMQNPRQAENMQYNTAAYDGTCGGGSYTEWMHCNGVIGFGNISDNFKSGRVAANDFGEEKELVVEDGCKLSAKVYPNPSHGNFSIEFNDISAVLEIRVVDFNGKVLHSQKDIQENLIKLSGLKQGTYILNVIGENQKISKKLIVK